MQKTYLSGPFYFGDQPPAHLMGWRGEPKDQATRSRIEEMRPFPVGPRMEIKKRPFVWDKARSLYAGKGIPTRLQATGDCVAVSLAQAGDYLSVAEKSENVRAATMSHWYSSWIYGIARVEIGQNSIPGPGAYGVWGAEAVSEYGVLFGDDRGVPYYDRKSANKMGEPPGPLGEFGQVAINRLVTEVSRCRSIEDIRAALQNECMVTIASDRGFRMQPYIKEGLHVYEPHGTWAHQMALIGWRDEPFPCAYRLNSWGPSAHGEPLNDEPPGGAWNLAEDLEKEIQDKWCEVYAYSGFLVEDDI